MSSHSNRPIPSSSKRPTTGSSRAPGFAADVHQMRQSAVFGSNSRSVNASNPGRPGKSGAEYVSMFPRPPMICRASLVASNSTHSSSPGTTMLTRLRLAIRQVPA